ncbi:MAG: MmgE/PrpD family protein [Gammaproteobacteria bacterium]|jgi:2-methylcitrate dehydratase PrpD|nr:MmgE/PrpD family protein [Gammaproteobacteria bacterium]
MTTETALQRISRRIAQTRFTPSTQSLGYLRDAFIDIYGCILIGASQPVAVKTRQALLASGQIYPQASAVIYGTEHRATPGAAAMANAIAGHALDFDDWEVPGNTHISVVLVPAILAASQGRSLSGKVALDAYLAGYETIARIGAAINLEHYDQGWHATATIGAIGAAAAVARLLELDSDQTANALALATSRGLGYNAQFGFDAKPVQVGFAVDGGVIAAQLAAAGVTGQVHMLEHATGMAALMSHADPARVARAMGQIGETLAIDDYHIVFKPWPCCGYTHRIMTGMLELHADGIDAASIDAIELHLPDMHAGILPFKQPRNQSEALFSLPYCAAMTLLTGNLTITDIANQSWRRTDVKNLIAKTSVHSFKPDRPELNYDPQQPDRIVIDYPGGQRRVDIAYPLGSPQRPLSAQQLLHKFQLNARLAEPKVDMIWQRLQDWPNCDDIHRLFTAFPEA